jgi:DNA-binding MarR family transcriptional regulator
MRNIEELKKMRFNFLNLLYEKSGGDKFNRSMVMNEIGAELGYEHADIQKICQYLEGEGLIEHVRMGGGIAITHYGVKEVEEAISNPEEPTHYFPPVNIINIHHMEGSQIQQGTNSSNQTGAFTLTNGIEINDFLKNLKGQLAELALNNEDESEIKSDIATLESQIDSSRPKPGIIKESLLSIQRILEGATGAVVAQQLLPYVSVLLAALN